jgi:hypothetical protein
LINCASSRDPALRASGKCPHIIEYAALSKSARALADGLMLVFQQPVRQNQTAARADGVAAILLDGNIGQDLNYL